MSAAVRACKEPQKAAALGWTGSVPENVGCMVKTTMFPGPSGGIAVHESAGGGGPLVFIHGNSSSARAFSRQLEGPLGARWRILAIDLPGHGQSDDARDPAAYLLPGQARTVIAGGGGLGVGGGVLGGGSGGGGRVVGGGA